VKIQMIAALAVASLLALTNATAAQTDKEAAPIVPQNPAATTSALYSALANGVKLGQGAAPDTASTDQALVALGYITAIEQMLSSGLVKPTIRICNPTEIRNDALARIVVIYVDGHPQAYSLPPAVVVAAAFGQAFPCHKP
jgi:hypothetical protein